MWCIERLPTTTTEIDRTFNKLKPLCVDIYIICSIHPHPHTLLFFHIVSYIHSRVHIHSASGMGYFSNYFIWLWFIIFVFFFLLHSIRSVKMRRDDVFLFCFCMLLSTSSLLVSIYQFCLFSYKHVYSSSSSFKYKNLLLTQSNDMMALKWWKIHLVNKYRYEKCFNGELHWHISSLLMTCAEVKKITDMVVWSWWWV